MRNPLMRIRQTLKRIGSRSAVPVRAGHAGEALASEHTWQPRADVYENKSQFMIIADVPGSDVERIDIAADGERLLVRAPITSAAGTVWQRAFVLPAGVDPNRARASYALGVLRIELPKQKTETKHIRVRRAA
jgi:HSP20 family protein